MQILITKPIRNTLIANFKLGQVARANVNIQEPEFEPALKLFCPWAAATWLITELDPDTNIAFGLAYLDGGYPELGLISIDELTAIRHPSGLRIERDISFKANGKSLNKYAQDARKLGYIAI